MAQPYSALALDAEQRSALREAEHRYVEHSQVVSDAQAQASVFNAWQSALAEAVGGSNMSLLAQVQAYWGAASSTVLTAELEVFPQPEQGV